MPGGLFSPKSALYPNRAQRRGLILLACILITHVYFRWYKRNWSAPEETLTSLQVSTQLEVLADSLSTLKPTRFAGRRQTRDRSFSTAARRSEPKEDYFEFDPNTLTDSGWVALGLSSGQVRVIRNFQNAGGSFDKPEDVGRLYTLPEGWFERHRKDIRIEQRTGVDNNQVASHHWSEQNAVADTEPESMPHARKYTEAVQPVELNSATEESLAAIRGVGLKSAVRILRFREALGGFIDTTQLAEVWGLHPEVRSKLVSVITIDTSLIRKIDLDTASVRTLASHPYISWEVARSLVRYREQHGRFQKVDDIRASYLVADSLAERIKPYLYATGNH